MIFTLVSIQKLKTSEKTPGMDTKRLECTHIIANKLESCYIKVHGINVAVNNNNSLGINAPIIRTAHFASNTLKLLRPILKQ
mmetsp:Transcript_34115/g.39553  ORF Transcript_34115/g.39553 Transcript_34115/m.39553 type:complete len:82 (+) Transcript_34115:1696-1941(+)